MGVKLADKLEQMNGQNYPLIDASAVEYKKQDGSTIRVDEALNSIESGGSLDLTEYQRKNDDTLNTTDKTIVGAINEIKRNADIMINDDEETEETVYSAVKIERDFASKIELANMIQDNITNEVRTYSSVKIENTFAKCQDLIIDEYITVSNPIGQLTKDTSLYGMNIVDIIKLIVQEEVQPWSGVAVLYGCLSDISFDTIEYASCGLSNDTTTSNIYILASYNNLSNEHAVFLCSQSSPVVYIEDQNGFNNTGEFDVKTVTINLPGGNSAKYLMYYTTNRLTFNSEFRYRFYFKEPY